MMSQTMNIVKGSEIRRSGTEALIKALGPVGMARYLEEYDNGGNGEYTESEILRKDGITKTANKCSDSVDKEKIVCYNMRSLRNINHMCCRV